MIRLLVEEFGVPRNQPGLTAGLDAAFQFDISGPAGGTCYVKAIHGSVEGRSTSASSSAPDGAWGRILASAVKSGTEEEAVPRISYVDPASLTDPELVEIMEYARRNGTPRPESQAVRAHVPELLRTFTAAWRTAFRDGVLDHRIKELCRLYVSRTVDCQYCGGQRSLKGAQQGVEESHYDDLLNFQTSERFNERERTALAYTEAITWNPDLADDALWERLHAHFTEPEIVELGYFVALTSGQQRWIRTLGIGHKELLADTDAGLAAHVARQAAAARPA